MKMHSLVHGHAHQAATHGHAFDSPRRYDLVAEVLFLGRRRATFQALMAAAGIQSGQRVLDVGCGTGYFVRLIAAAVGSGGLALGIDPSTAMVEYARGKAARGAHAHFLVGTAEALEFPDDHFDVVVSSLVVHHLAEDVRTQALTDMRRVLRPGGRVLVAEAQSPRHGWGWRLLARLHGYDRMARLVPHLEPLAAQAGFGEIRTGEVPPWIRYVVATKP
jgi:ubiquinone/menaquinone biosynthesis C-methylase UbiE